MWKAIEKIERVRYGGTAGARYTSEMWDVRKWLKMILGIIGFYMSVFLYKSMEYILIFKIKRKIKFNRHNEEEKPLTCQVHFILR